MLKLDILSQEVMSLHSEIALLECQVNDAFAQAKLNLRRIQLKALLSTRSASSIGMFNSVSVS